MGFGRNSSNHGAGFDITRSLDSRTRIVNGKILEAGKPSRRRRFFGGGKSKSDPAGVSNPGPLSPRRMVRAVSSVVSNYTRGQSIGTPRGLDDSSETGSMAHANTIMNKFEAERPNELILVKATPESLPDQSAFVKKYRDWDEKPLEKAGPSLADRILAAGPDDPANNIDIRHTIATDVPFLMRSDSASTLGFDQSDSSASQRTDPASSPSFHKKGSELYFTVHPGPPEDAGLLAGSEEYKKNSLTSTTMGEIARVAKREVGEKTKRFRSTERRSQSVGAELKKEFTGYGERGASYKSNDSSSPNSQRNMTDKKETPTRGSGRLTSVLLDKDSPKSPSRSKVSKGGSRPKPNNVRAVSTGRMPRQSSGVKGLSDDDGISFHPTPTLQLQMV